MGECSFKYGNDKLNTFIKDEQVIQILKPQQVEKIKNIEFVADSVLYYTQRNITNST